MSIESEIKDVITAKLEEGIVEKLVAENLEKGINKSLENLLGGYGEVTKFLEKKIKEVMLEQLSGYDYSKYVIKLDCVLTEILQKTTLDNKKILENFKELMIEEKFGSPVKISDIFDRFKKFVAEEIDTSKLEVDYDDSPSYEDVTVTAEVEHEEGRSWSSMKYAKIVLECEKDESLNREIRISKFDHFAWRLESKINSSIDSLRHLDQFDMYLLKLQQASVSVDLDDESLTDDVTPEREPEATYE